MKSRLWQYGIPLVLVLFMLVAGGCGGGSGGDDSGDGNDASLEITTTSLPNGTVGTVYSSTLTATGGTAISWSVVSGNLPDGLSLIDGTISGTPTAAGTYTFTIQASNHVDSDTKDLSITIGNVAAESGINGTWVLESTTEKVWIEGVHQPDRDKTITSFVATDASGNVALAEVEIKADKDTSDNFYSIVFRQCADIRVAGNSQPYRYHESFTCEYQKISDEEYIWTIKDTPLERDGYVERVYKLLDTDTLQITEILVDGSASYRFYPYATYEQERKLIFKRSGGSVPVAPTITTASLPNGQTDTAYCDYIPSGTQYVLTATGSASITWSIESGSLPDGLSLSSSGIISGIPKAGGTFSFIVEAANSAGSDTKNLSILIDPSVPAPKILFYQTAAQCMIGQPLSFSIPSTGNKPIIWTIENGSLPYGLILSPSGVISGSPTTEGVFNVTIKAENSAGSDTKDFLMFVFDTSDSAPVAPTIIITSLPNGTIGTAYSRYFFTVTGSMPFTWSLESGSLPDGLSLSPSGFISGIPKAVGTFSFIVEAENSAGSDMKNLSIQITN